MKKLIILFAFVLSLVSCSKSFDKGNIVKTKEETVGAVSEMAFYRMLSASNRRDAKTFGEMIFDGELYIIKGGEECKIIDVKVGKIKCRVKVNGIERDLWINSSHLK